jgi:hypothetical protein
MSTQDSSRQALGLVQTGTAALYQKEEDPMTAADCLSTTVMFDSLFWLANRPPRNLLTTSFLPLSHHVLRERAKRARGDCCAFQAVPLSSSCGLAPNSQSKC